MPVHTIPLKQYAQAYLYPEGGIRLVKAEGKRHGIDTFR